MHKNDDVCKRNDTSQTNDKENTTSTTKTDDVQNKDDQQYSDNVIGIITHSQQNRDDIEMKETETKVPEDRSTPVERLGIRKAFEDLDEFSSDEEPIKENVTNEDRSKNDKDNSMMDVTTSSTVEKSIEKSVQNTNSNGKTSYENFFRNSYKELL